MVVKKEILLQKLISPGHILLKLHPNLNRVIAREPIITVIPQPLLLLGSEPLNVIEERRVGSLEIHVISGAYPGRNNLHENLLLQG